MQRLTHMCGLVQSSSVAVTPSRAVLIPGLRLIGQTQARFQSGMRVTAFEQAMQELYGDTWKHNLNNRQRSYIAHHEQRRQTWQAKEAQRKSSGELDEESQKPVQPTAEWRQKVEKIKSEIMWQKKLQSHGDATRDTFRR